MQKMEIFFLAGFACDFRFSLCHVWHVFVRIWKCFNVVFHRLCYFIAQRKRHDQVCFFLRVSGYSSSLSTSQTRFGWIKLVCCTNTDCNIHACSCSIVCVTQLWCVLSVLVACKHAVGTVCPAAGSDRLLLTLCMNKSVMWHESD